MRANIAVAAAAAVAFGASQVAAQVPVTYLNPEFGDVLVYTAVAIGAGTAQVYTSDAPVYTYVGGVGAPDDVAGLPAVFPPAGGALPTTTALVPTTTSRRTTVAAVATTTFVPGGAALGGGGGGAATQATLQVIAGYNPPPSSVLRPPTLPTGSVLNASDIPGYSDSDIGNQNSGSAGSGSGGSRPSVSSAQGMHNALPMTLTAGFACLLAVIVMV